MTDLFSSPSSTLRWLEMPEGTAFLDWVNASLAASRKQLEKEAEPIEIYRRQGKVEALKMIVNLPEELRELMKRKVA